MLTLLPKGVQTKLLKYLREFSKKFETV
jgi:hypothetical protein